MIELDRVLHEKKRAMGKTAYEQFLCKEIADHWDEIVDESIAAQIRPVKLEHGVLFVDGASSALKDQLKFFAEEIIDELNEIFGQEPPPVKEIRIARSFQVPDKPPPPEPSQPPEEIVTLEQITLTDAEQKACVEQAAVIENEELRETVLVTLLTQARSKKFRLATGWHKCRNCDALCPPDEIFCEVCRVKERAAMIDELYRIFYDAPWTKTADAQKLLLKKMPHMRRECQPDVVESARTSLIQKIASQVRFGDEDSPTVLKAVMLAKQLPPEKLTPKIIQRALIDLQFNLADQPKFRRYNALKSQQK